MNFNISGFTNVGTSRIINQDCILMQGNVYNSGIYSLDNQNDCFCFVADGVGGNPVGDIASDFLLNNISVRLKNDLLKSKENIIEVFEKINSGLFELMDIFPERKGMASTLVGFCYVDSNFYILNAGDSPLWVLRNDMFFKVTEDHVLNSNIQNSPITSFFGGYNPELKISFYDDIVRELNKDDIFLLCSDGLFKSLTQKQIKMILSSNQPINEKCNFLLDKALNEDAIDNISAIIINVK